MYSVLTTFVLDLGSEIACWNVGKIDHDAMAGKFGIANKFSLAGIDFDWVKGNLYRERVEAIKARPLLLYRPVIAVEAPPPDDDSLLYFVDGKHRLAALVETGHKWVAYFSVPWFLERSYRIYEPALCLS